MFGTHDLALFVVSGLLLNIAPGPDTLYIMTRGATQGWKAGSVGAFGICSGVFVHILAAALGLSALLATSSTAFLVVKLAGAAYLLYMGVVMIRGQSGNVPAHAPDGMDVPDAPRCTPLSWRNIFWQGFLTNVLNPKVALFFLAFVPQFINADAPNKALSFIVLGAIFDFNSLLWCQFLAVSSALAGQRVKANRTVRCWLDRLTGLVFVSFGIKLALANRA